MTTYPAYFDNTYLFQDATRIIKLSKDDQGPFIVLNQTIFYPQGGGQPSDQGTIHIGEISIPVYSVKSVDQEIRHYTDQDYSHLIGQEGICALDQGCAFCTQGFIRQVISSATLLSGLILSG